MVNLVMFPAPSHNSGHGSVDKAMYTHSRAGGPASCCESGPTYIVIMVLSANTDLGRKTLNRQSHEPRHLLVARYCLGPNTYRMRADVQITLIVLRRLWWVRKADSAITSIWPAKPNMADKSS